MTCCQPVTWANIDKTTPNGTRPGASFVETHLMLVMSFCWNTYIKIISNRHRYKRVNQNMAYNNIFFDGRCTRLIGRCTYSITPNEFTYIGSQRRLSLSRKMLESRVIHEYCLKRRGLTHWGRVTYICVGNLTIIGPDNGLSSGRRRAIIWTNAGTLLTGP